MMTLYDNLPTLDLHGIDRDFARILINEFLADNYKIKNLRVVIIHGIGSGIIRKTTQDTLKKSKLVESYKIDNFNTGMTIVELHKNLDK